MDAYNVLYERGENGLHIGMEEERRERLYQIRFITIIMRAELWTLPHACRRTLSRMRRREGNQSCKIAGCSLLNGKPEYCSQCGKYPCEKYEGIDEFDSFITHCNQKKDLKKRDEIGTQEYQAQQKEKMDLLEWLLENYNDGRKNRFFVWQSIY